MILLYLFYDYKRLKFIILILILEIYKLYCDNMYDLYVL